MQELPPLISDLAYILMVAGAVTIVFKRLRQPLVLGYIVAGFLAGPHMPYTPSVSDMASLEDWGQIGVIFLMFTLGLDFSFKKIVRMGARPVVSALLVMTCMMSVGIAVGYAFSWGRMDRLFLGGMLAMSSTTIIYKAFDDMGLRSKPFASGVLSVLVLEDILGILLMVVLSALAVSRSLEGGALAGSCLKLAFFLILWFLVGVYMVPLLLRKARRYINSETLLVVAVGLCFLLVAAAARVGYSPAFGAFMMGSILAETVEAERIEGIVAPLRDLFGAVFFVSVGMLVDVSVLAEYWLPVVAVTLAVVAGQTVLGSMSFLLAGAPLGEAVQSGFSLAQIGEFAFIIASLGQSLGVTHPFLYPVVVAVSIITTFLTPYVIRLAPAVSERLRSVLPLRVARGGEAARKSALPDMGDAPLTLSAAWRSLLRATAVQTAAYLTLCVALILLGFAMVLPVCRTALGHWTGNAVCGLLVLAALAPCIRPVVMRKMNSGEARLIRSSGRAQRFLFLALMAARIYAGAAVVYYIINFLSPLWWPWHVAASVALLAFIAASRRVKLASIVMERTFLLNLRSRERLSATGYGRRLRGRDLRIASVTVPMTTKWGGKTLAQLRFGSEEHVYVVAIIRSGQRVNIPGPSRRVYPGDTLELAGDERGIAAFRERMSLETWRPGDERTERRLAIASFSLRGGSPLCGKTLRETDFRARHNCLVLGVEDGRGSIGPSEAGRRFLEGDTVWVVGEREDIRRLGVADG